MGEGVRGREVKPLAQMVIPPLIWWEMKGGERLAKRV